ncbi:Glyoxalase/bleomycin resistance protein/dioxygenase [Sphingomonas paucimobilis]|nr:Glyoxalase/bleomycin resistance protein/dioxygenase [Sphingomonas paucimobilis]
MAILGIETVIYCVDDMEKSADFFEDYGLTLKSRTAGRAHFTLPDNSNVILQLRATHPIPGSQIVGLGVHETVWGVDCEEHLEDMVRRIGTDREVRRDEDGTAHFVADGGVPMALRLWPRFRMPQTSVDPVNSPGNVNRLNVHRKWINRCIPKRMMHVVFFVADPGACARFVRERLDFRVSDTQRGFGVYLRADGTMDHHNIFFYNSHTPFAPAKGQTAFSHVNYQVTDLDEIMTGRNYMTRRGWAKSHWGLGRHRISSALFHYIPCPAGGEAEYGADSDALDDNWIPRDFDAMFGFAHWMHDIPEFWMAGHDWSVGFAEGFVENRGEIEPRPYNVQRDSSGPGLGAQLKEAAEERDKPHQDAANEKASSSLAR